MKIIRFLPLQLVTDQQLLTNGLVKIENHFSKNQNEHYLYVFKYCI